jgi:putative tricarboxylic transport membrane protein
VIANAQLWGSLFWLAIGVFITFEGRNLGLGTSHEPGSGFALFWIGLIMSALALSESVKAVRHGSPSIASLWSGTRWQKVLIVTVMLLVFGFAFEGLGFIICSLAMLLILMFFIDPVAPRTAILVSFAATFVVWGVLTEALKIQMPAGLLAGPPEDMLRAGVRSLMRAVSAVLR